MFSYEEVARLRQDGVIARETAKQLALDVHALPRELALSWEEERREREREARMQARERELGGEGERDDEGASKSATGKVGGESSREGAKRKRREDST